MVEQTIQWDKQDSWKHGFSNFRNLPETRWTWLLAQPVIKQTTRRAIPSVLCISLTTWKLPIIHSHFIKLFQLFRKRQDSQMTFHRTWSMVSAECNLTLFKSNTKDNAPNISIIRVLMVTTGHNRLSSARFTTCTEDKSKSDWNYGSVTAPTLPSSSNVAVFHLSSTTSLRSRLCTIASLISARMMDIHKTSPISCLHRCAGTCADTTTKKATFRALCICKRKTCATHNADSIRSGCDTSRRAVVKPPQTAPVTQLARVECHVFV